MGSRKKLGEILIEAGLIDEFQLNTSLSYQQSWGGRLGSIILKKGFVTEADMMSAVARQLDIPSISLSEMQKPSSEVLEMVKVDTAKKHAFFPVALEGKTMLVAVADPTDLKALDEIGFVLGVRVKPLLALESDIMKAIGRAYEGKVPREHAEGLVSTSPDSRSYHSMDYAAAEHIRKAKDAANAGTTVDRNPKARADISQKVVLESLVELLVEKGMITREELMNRIRAKSLSR